MACCASGWYATVVFEGDMVLKVESSGDAEENDEDAPQEASDVEGSYESGQVDSAGPSSQLRRASRPRLAKRRRSEEDEDM